jgi:hypothetical protein
MKKEIEAKTFTPIYDSVEDRIRLIINYEDMQNRVDMMITRAFIIKLIYLIEDYLANNFISDDTKLQEQTEQNYTTKTKDEYIDLTIQEELLLEVNLTLLEDKKNVLFTLNSKNITTKSILNKDILKLFVENLKKSIPKYDWGIHF